MKQRSAEKWNGSAVDYQRVFQLGQSDYNRAVLAFWLERGMLRPGCRVLDIGCGVGKYGVMLADLGCVNIADSESGLLENLSLETILAADPDYIFVVIQGTDTTKAERLLETTRLSNPAWNELTAVREDRYHVMDQRLYNVKPNARWGEAYEKLADILYPEQ